MAEIREQQIFDSFWSQFCESLDKFEKAKEVQDVTYEPVDEKHYISFTDGEVWTVKIEVEKSND